MRPYPITLKGCPRCGGDLFPDYDPPDWNQTCLQCGYTRWIRPVSAQGAGLAAAATVVAMPTWEEEKDAA